MSAESNGALVGKVSNDLGVALVDTEVVTASGLESQSSGTWDWRCLVSGRLGGFVEQRCAGRAAPGHTAREAETGERPKNTRRRCRASTTSGPCTRARRVAPPCWSPSPGTPLPAGPRDGSGASRAGGRRRRASVASGRAGARAAVLGPELVGSRGAASGAAEQLSTVRWPCKRGVVRLPVHPPRQGLGTPGTELRLLDGSATNAGMAMASSPASSTGTSAATAGQCGRKRLRLPDRPMGAAADE